MQALESVMPASEQKNACHDQQQRNLFYTQCTTMMIEGDDCAVFALIVGKMVRLKERQAQEGKHQWWLP